MSAVQHEKPFGWHATPTMNGTAFDIGAADGANIALVHGPGNGGEEEFEDYARLIAAAPDLLSALRRCLNFIGNTEAEFGDELECGHIARAAIAKAEGRP